MKDKKENVDTKNNKVNESDFLFGNNKGPEILKALDNISIEVNNKIKMRGISRGLICIVEDFNKNILLLEKIITHAYRSRDFEEKLNLIESTKTPLEDMWLDIRYLLKNKGLTIGEIGVLSELAYKAQEQIQKWNNSTRTKAMESQG